MDVSRDAVLRYRVHAQELDSTSVRRRDAAILDLGVQDTGPDGFGWALANRGAQVPTDDLALAWTLRGAPHAYRRDEIAAVAAATAPWSEADAAKRIFDAAKPLKAAGIPVLDALDTVATTMRDIATKPVVKGEMSSELTRRLDEPYLRWCNPCQATHSYEQPFRLSALQAGLELEPGTSPPVLHRIKGWRGPAKRVPEQLDVVRAVLHFLGPSTPKLVAGYVDSPVKEVAARWPEDVETVEVDGAELDILAEDARRAGRRRAGRRGAAARPVRPVPAGPRPRARGPRRGCAQGPLAGARPPRRRPRRPRARRLLAAPGLGQEAQARGDRCGAAAAGPKALDEQAERLAAFRGVEFAGYV